MAGVDNLGVGGDNLSPSVKKQPHPLIGAGGSQKEDNRAHRTKVTKEMDSPEMSQAVTRARAKMARAGKTVKNKKFNFRMKN